MSRANRQKNLIFSRRAVTFGMDRKTVRRYIARGLEPLTYGPRPPQQRSTDPFLAYLRERLAAYPGLTAVRLWRELRERGYAGGYTAVKRTVAAKTARPLRCVHNVELPLSRQLLFDKFAHAARRCRRAWRAPP